MASCCVCVSVLWCVGVVSFFWWNTVFYDSGCFMGSEFLDALPGSRRKTTFVISSKWLQHLSAANRGQCVTAVPLLLLWLHTAARRTDFLLRYGNFVSVSLHPLRIVSSLLSLSRCPLVKSSLLLYSHFVCRSLISWMYIILVIFSFFQIFDMLFLITLFRVSFLPLEFPSC